MDFQTKIFLLQLAQTTLQTIFLFTLTYWLTTRNTK
jgi:hypothetical protein